MISKFDLWKKYAIGDKDVARELKEMEHDKEALEDAFYRELSFGTGGLRGVIGAGTNRMNIYTVAKASQGLANYINKTVRTGKRKIAVGFDSRIKSELFAKVSSEVFAGNDIQVEIYSELMPTPCLSYAVRYLKCAAGIMITASHNPSKYNGYKVYGSDGCQITTEAAREIFQEIEKIDVFADVKKIDFEEGIKKQRISYISDTVYTAFVEAVKEQSMEEGAEIDKNMSVVYSPLNGTGLKPVLRTLKEMGYTNVMVVPEQENPDGFFPTCPYPNPEIREAMELGMKYAKNHNADLLLATDPDCDRAGIAVRNKEGEYILLSGNETGMLMLDYICSRRIEMNRMPDDPIIIKTIVTIDMAERIAEHYGVHVINVLTGFKFIGEQIGLLEKQGKKDSFIFGFEESYGYLSGSYVRDKDAVDASLLICEMFAYYKTRGITLLEKLDELYSVYGYYMNTLHSYEFDGAAGFVKMQRIMNKFREGEDNIGGKKVKKCLDYLDGIDGLPKSDVLKYYLQEQCSVVVRPSGTEPKLKIYISVSAQNKESAEYIEKMIHTDLTKRIYSAAV